MPSLLQGHCYRSRTGKCERWFKPAWIDENQIPKQPLDLKALKVGAGSSQWDTQITAVMRVGHVQQLPSEILQIMIGPGGHRWVSCTGWCVTGPGCGPAIQRPQLWAGCMPQGTSSLLCSPLHFLLAPGGLCPPYFAARFDLRHGQTALFCIACWHRPPLWLSHPHPACPAASSIFRLHDLLARPHPSPDTVCPICSAARLHLCGSEAAYVRCPPWCAAVGWPGLLPRCQRGQQVGFQVTESFHSVQSNDMQSTIEAHILLLAHIGT